MTHKAISYDRCLVWLIRFNDLVEVLHPGVSFRGEFSPGGDVGAFRAAMGQLQFRGEQER